MLEEYPSGGCSSSLQLSLLITQQLTLVRSSLGGRAPCPPRSSNNGSLKSMAPTGLTLAQLTSSIYTVTQHPLEEDQRLGPDAWSSLGCDDSLA